MKNHVLKMLALVIVSASVLTGCDLFDSVGEVTIHEPISSSLTVDENNAGTNITYAEEVLVDASSNPEIEKYENKIKSISINKITFRISGYSGEESITPSSSVSYSLADDSGSAVEIASLANFNIKAAATAGTETELTISDADLKKIASILEDDMAIKFHLNGTLSNAPVEFNVVFTVDTSITADAIE